MSKTAATGLVSIVMVMAMTGVYLSKQHPHSHKEDPVLHELPTDIPIIIKLDAQPIAESVLYNKIARSVQFQTERSSTSQTASPPAMETGEMGGNKSEVLIPNVKSIDGIEEVFVPIASVSHGGISGQTKVYEINTGSNTDVAVGRRNKIKEVLNSNTFVNDKR